ncbi:MAG: DivIVA family protein, partial [Modestobacter sp.]|nr:DivIVA family protein [Modestobacter sp.]
MPLTPADVHNVAFKKPPIGKRGYDEEEVDAFLDLIEIELAKLIEENSQMRAGIAPPAPVEPSDGGSEQDAAAIQSLQQTNSALSEQIVALENQIAASRDELEGARQTVAQAQQEAAPAREAAAAAQQAADQAIAAAASAPAAEA